LNKLFRLLIIFFVILFLTFLVIAESLEAELPILGNDDIRENKDETLTFEQGTADVKAGTTVSGTEQGYEFSEVDNLETETGDIIEQGESVQSNRDNSLFAAIAQKATLQSTPAPTTMENIRNMYTAGNRLTFDSAESLDTEENDNIPKTHGDNVRDAVIDNKAFQIAGASYLELGNNKYANVNNLQYIYNSQQTTYSYADSSIAEIAEVQNGDEVLLGNSKITAQYADIISTDELTLSKVKNLEIIFDENDKISELKLTSDKDDNIIKLKNINIELDTDSSLDYQENNIKATNAKLSFSNEQFTESVSGTSISLDFSQQSGFYSLTLSKDSEYEVKFDNGNDLKLVPETDDYIIFIRKSGSDIIDTSSMTNKNFALVDLVKKTINLNGLANYQKKNKEIIKSIDQNNEFLLTFDKEFKEFDLKLINKDVSNLVDGSILANVSFGDYELTENLINDKIHTIAYFSHKSSTNYIKSYEHEFNLDYLSSKIELVDNKLVQTTSTNQVILFSKDISRPNLIQEIKDYKPKHCDKYNLYYNDNEYLPNYIDSLIYNGNDITAAAIGFSNFDYEQSTYLFILLGLLFFSTIALYHKKNKKSQITIYIAVGILILIAIGVLIGAVNSLSKSNIKASVINEYDTSSINSYTTDCLTTVAECSLAHQGLNHGYIIGTDTNLDKNTFQQQTKLYLDKVLMQCYEQMPHELKTNVKVSYFDSNINYIGNVIIEVNSDMSVRNDFSEQEMSTYKLNPNKGINKLIDFAQPIKDIDLTYLGESDYNVNVYDVENTLFIITDEEGFKLVK